MLIFMTFVAFLSGMIENHLQGIDPVCHGDVPMLLWADR